MMNDYYSNPDFIYLNIGTSSCCSRQTLEVIQQGLQLEAQYGGGSQTIQTMKLQALQLTRERLSNLLFCSHEEIALTTNTTDGVNIVANGLTFQPGDEVIVSDAEHYSALMPWLNLQKTQGILLKILAISKIVDEKGELVQEILFEELQRLITKKCRIVFLSHVLYTTGLELPIARIARYLREKHVLFLVDGAQAIGHIPVNMQEIGCDFYAFTGAKWLNGPTGTGGVYLRKDCLAQLRHVFSGWATVNDPVKFTYKTIASGFEISTRNIPLFKGLIHVVEEYQKNPLGRGAHIDQFTRKIRSCIEARTSTFTILSPSTSRGIITYTGKTQTSQEIFTLLTEQQIIGRYIDSLQAVRFSVPFFLAENSLSKIEMALKSIS